MLTVGLLELYQNNQIRSNCTAELKNRFSYDL